MLHLAHNGTPRRLYELALALASLTAGACGPQLAPANEATGVEGGAAAPSLTVGHTGQAAPEISVAGRGASPSDRSSPEAAAASEGAQLLLAGSGGGSGGSSADGGARLWFDAGVEGDLIFIDASGPAASSLFMAACSSPWRLYQQGEQGQVQVKDDRPPASGHAGYYLDDEYIPPPPASEPCDTAQCVGFPSGRIEVAETYEYLRVGTKAAPPDASDPSKQLPNIERRPLSGPVSVVVSYFEDSACQELSGSGSGVELPMSSEGVCCPIGVARCSSAGPGGGWAPSFDQCAPFSEQSDVNFEQRVDPRGCPELVANHAVGCDDDGGADSSEP